MKKAKYERDTILNDLRANVVEVFFEKVDGTMRTMRCTLQEHLLPRIPENAAKIEKNIAANPNLVVAWDVEAGGWRSFHVDSVDYVQLIPGDYYA
jgi:hypothetical protein